MDPYVHYRPFEMAAMQAAKEIIEGLWTFDHAEFRWRIRVSRWEDSSDRYNSELLIKILRNNNLETLDEFFLVWKGKQYQEFTDLKATMLESITDLIDYVKTKYQ